MYSTLLLCVFLWDKMWIILVVLFVLLNFLHALNENFQGRGHSNDTSSSGIYNNNNPRTRSGDSNSAVESSEPQTPRREWLSSSDEEELYSDLERSTEATVAEEDDFISFVNDPVPQTPHFHMLGGEPSSQGDHPPTAHRSVNTPISRTPYRGYDFDDLKILFFKLDPVNMRSEDTEFSELVPPSLGEPIDLDSGTMLITSLKDANNNSRKVEFRMSPLRGKHDVVLVYTTEGVLAARITNMQLKESRAFIDDTITKLQSLAESGVPSPKPISWLHTHCEVGLSQIPPMKVCFIITNNDGAVIRGSRIPNGIPRNTYTVFSGGFRSLRFAFDTYFKLKGQDFTELRSSHPESGRLSKKKHKLNGERGLLITCPTLAHGLEGGIFVRDEDGQTWNEYATL